MATNPKWSMWNMFTHTMDFLNHTLKSGYTPSGNWQSQTMYDMQRAQQPNNSNGNNNYSNQKQQAKPEPTLTQQNVEFVNKVLYSGIGLSFKAIGKGIVFVAERATESKLEKEDRLTLKSLEKQTKELAKFAKVVEGQEKLAGLKDSVKNQKQALLDRVNNLDSSGKRMESLQAVLLVYRLEPTIKQLFQSLRTAVSNAEPLSQNRLA